PLRRKQVERKGAATLNSGKGGCQSGSILSSFRLLIVSEQLAKQILDGRCSYPQGAESLCRVSLQKSAGGVKQTRLFGTESQFRASQSYFPDDKRRAPLLLRRIENDFPGNRRSIWRKPR